MYRRLLALWTLSMAAAAPLAWAQPASNSAKPDPQDANASVPRVIYRSSLANYRALSDEKVTSWKETNDNVGRIGGWRAYAKEAQEPEPAGDSMPPGAKKPVPADSAKPVQGRMRGHKMN
ncbi:MAG: hypothetical protein ACTS6O_03150 [Giesbergeria sp.]